VTWKREVFCEAKENGEKKKITQKRRDRIKPISLTRKKQMRNKDIKNQHNILLLSLTWMKFASKGANP